MADNEAQERVSNQRRSSKLMDAEQAARVQALNDADEYAEIERKQNVKRASNAASLEQQRRVSEVAADEAAAAAERAENQAAADVAAEEERVRRLSLNADADAAAEQERASVRRDSLKKLDEEQQRRINEPPQPPASEVSEARSSVLGAVDQLPTGDEGEGSGAAYQASAGASKNVSDLLATDAADESLQRYKAQLLGAAAQGDLGDVNDPRRVIVTEFRVIFEEAGVPDVVYNLDSEAGLAHMKNTPFVIKEGSEYKFQILFRVQHEIVAGLKFANKVKKGIFTQSDEVMLGSYAPQSAPHRFTFPRDRWSSAPKGMMYRGKYNSKDRYLDSDGAQHLEYEYSFEIKKGWK